MKILYFNNQGTLLLDTLIDGKMVYCETLVEPKHVYIPCPEGLDSSEVFFHLRSRVKHDNIRSVHELKEKYPEYFI